jgi:hypothetical protein
LLLLSHKPPQRLLDRLTSARNGAYVGMRRAAKHDYDMYAERGARRDRAKTAREIPRKGCLAERWAQAQEEGRHNTGRVD